MNPATSLWHVNLLTLFPEMFPGMLGQSLSGRALERNIWSYDALDIRSFATDRHRTVDDTPFGGGAGMVMRPDVIEAAFSSIKDPGHAIYMSPRGRPLTQGKVEQLCALPRLTILCGRYEGVDQRVLDAHDFEEISIGDYVLSGGEPAAMILMDACIRLLPDVMGNVDTAGEESFSDGLLEYPHYTRPAEWVDSKGVPRDVPEVLKTGHHQKIRAWRQAESLRLTQDRRPDLIEKLRRGE